MMFNRGNFNNISQEKKSLISNFISLSLLQVVGYICPLMTIPYLAHTIGMDKYGEIAFASAVMVYLQTIVDYGFVFSAVRDIARCKGCVEDVSRIYSTVMWSRWLLVLLSFLLMVILICIVPKLMEMRWVLLTSFLMIIGYAMFPDWMFQALEKMKYITIFNIGIKILFTSMVFLFIKRPDDFLLQPLFMAMGYIISGIGAMLLISRWKIKLKRPPVGEIVYSLKSNIDLFVNQIIPNLYNSASILLLGFIHGDSSNAIYDVANKFNTVGSSFFTILSRTFYPFLSRRSDKHSFFGKINILSSSFIAVLLFVFAKPIINTFFPPEFNGSIITLQIISFSLIGLSLNNVFGTNYLILNGYEKTMRKITLYSSLAGLIVAIPSVYYFSYIGVAITILFSRLSMGLASMIIALKLRHKYSFS